MTCYSLFYLPSYNYVFRGTKKQLYQHLKSTGEFLFGGRNGSWTVGMPPERKILVIVNNTITDSVSPDNFLHNFVGLSRITKLDCLRLVDNLNNGTVTISEVINA